MVGSCVGELKGYRVGEFVDSGVGDLVGFCVGGLVGSGVGKLDGSNVGGLVGFNVGISVCCSDVGAFVGGNITIGISGESFVQKAVVVDSSEASNGWPCMLLSTVVAVLEGGGIGWYIFSLKVNITTSSGSPHCTYQTSNQN